jgi:hypothetical protein
VRLIEAGGFGTRRCRGESGSSVLNLSGPFASCGGSVLVGSALPTSEKPIAGLTWPNFTSADHDSLSFEGPGTEVELASHIH